MGAEKRKHLFLLEEDRGGFQSRQEKKKKEGIDLIGNCKKHGAFRNLQ